MTQALDASTLFKISGMLYLLMAVMTWMMLGRPRRGPVLVWCLGGVLISLSVWLISQRGQWSGVWTDGLAQTAYLASFGVLAQSLRMDLGRAWRWRWLLAILLVYAAVITFGFGDQHSQILAIGVRLANVVGLFVLTATALMLARRERSRNGWIMTLGYGLMGAAMLAATWSTLQGHANLQFLQDGGVFLLLGATSLLTLILSHMGYLGLALERSLRHNMALRQSQWQSQQWRERSQALALHDRQRTLAVLANSLGHAILQPLTATLLQLEIARRLLRSPQPDAPQVQQSLAQVVQGLRRSADLVKHIRNFLRPAVSNATGQALPLQAVMQDAQDLLRQELMYQGIVLQVSAAPSPVLVHAQRLPLTQALVQVLRNAMQAVRGQPRRVIEMQLKSEGALAWIEVRDSGPGFARQGQTAHAWESTPATDAWTGLGLEMTRGILSQFDGELSWQNAPTGGAQVRLSLPLA